MNGAGGQGGAGTVPPCPVPNVAYESGLLGQVGCGVLDIGAPTYDAGECCYHVTWGCCSGRPFLIDDRPRTAEIRVAACGWTGAPEPAAEQLAPRVRAFLSEAWLRDALLEHASVASFSRFSLELLAVGAPSDLVDAAHEAARDEVRHARACFTLASAYAGGELGPGALPLGGSLAVSSDLAAIAASAVKEGCVGETLAAVQATEQLAVATDPAVRAALGDIVRDEAKHAELAWRFVAWAVQTGGDDVRRAVTRAFTEALAAPVDLEPLPDLGVELAQHGRAQPAVLRAAFAATIAETIRPAARLLERSAAAAPTLRSSIA